MNHEEMPWMLQLPATFPRMFLLLLEKAFPAAYYNLQQQSENKSLIKHHTHGLESTLIVEKEPSHTISVQKESQIWE